MLVTSKDIVYKVAGRGHIATIPKGTPVIDASNLPIGGYWVLRWVGMTDEQDSWWRNYGFHVWETEVTDNDQTG